MDNAEKSKDSWEQLSRRYAGRPVMFAVHGIAEMIAQAVKKTLPFVILLGIYFYLDHESTEAESRFRDQMEKEIQYITKDLEKTGLPKETSESIGWSLRMVGQNVGFYVRDQFFLLSLFLILLGIMLIPTNQKKKEANAIRGRAGEVFG